MIKRHFTAHSLNVVVNDPSIFPWVRGSLTERLDLTPVVEDHNNVLLMGEYGGVLFTQNQPGVYEAHTQVLPAGRGEWCLKMVQEALEWMFTRTDCVDIITRVPKGNIPARALARSIHGKFEFRMENGWTLNGKVVPADIFSLQIQGWMATAPGLEEWGDKFHQRLTAEYEKHGKTGGPNHGHDPVHDRYVGAAYLMFRNGQPVKGMIFYNRWAKICGYTPITLTSVDPVVIDMQESLLAIENGDFFVLRIK